MLKLSKRRHFQEWSLWVISVMDPWALWHSPVICFGGKTYCEHIMQRISHPWPFSNTSLGFSVMYSLASVCAWWCIHCPSGVGSGCQFYHFIFSSIIKLVCIRQHRKFILFSLPCTVTSFPTHWAALTAVPAASIETLQHHTVNVPPQWLVLDTMLLEMFAIAKIEIWMEKGK